MRAALQTGQTIEWDETIVDTVTPPASLNDSSSDFRELAIRRQTKTYHVTVTVPDTSVHHFMITREVTQYAQRDTMGGQRIAKEVTYGSNFTSYDPDNNVIQSYTLEGGDSSEDFTDMPFFEFRPDTVVTDSLRTAFVDTMTAMGATVTNLGTDGYKVASTFTEGTDSWNDTAYFDHDYLALTKNTSSGNGTTSNTYYTYSSVDGYRINTLRRTEALSSLSTDLQSWYTTYATFVNSDLFATTTVTTLQLSGIILP